MVMNDLLTALRSVFKHRVYTLINVVGLAIGIAACLIIALYLRHEFSYNTQHKDVNQLYRLIRHVRLADNSPEYDARGAQWPAGINLVSEIPEVQDATGFIVRPMWAGLDDRGFNIDANMASDNFLQFLTYPLLAGGRPKLTPNAAYVTESFAHKLYGSTDVVGKPVKLKYKWVHNEFQIAGILKDIPNTTSAEFRFDILVSHRSVRERGHPFQDHWRPTSLFMVIRTVLRLAPGVDPESLNAKLDAFAERHLGADIGQPETYRLLPLTRMHLYAKHDFNIEVAGTQAPFGDIYRCYAFATICLSILLLACVNYVNLVTARGVRQGLEVGIRKVLGATRAQLAQRFLWEAIILCGIAGLGAVGLVTIFLPLASDMLGLGNDLAIDRSMYVFAAGMTILVGLLSGIYPALFLSKFKLINTLKGPAGGSTTPRKMLIVFQFSVSVVLIVSTLIAHDQITFLMNKDLGFERESRITIPIFLEDQSLRKQYLNVRARFDQVSGVTESCLSNLLIGTEGSLSRLYLKKPGSTDSTNVFIKQVDERFTNVYHIKILEGRTLESNDMAKRNVLINQTAARATGLKAGDIAKGRGNDFNIVGIYEDFHNRSLHLPIRPLILRSQPLFNYVTVRIQTDNLTQTLDDLKTAWHEFLPNHPFQYEFVDDKFTNFYRDDRRMLQAFTVLAAIAILIACLGLLGLISFVTEMRTKEIAVRRVLGSSTTQLMSLLLGDFAKLVGIAAVLAWPVAYLITQSWLTNFTYRIDLGLIPFLIGGLLALVIALITISYQTLRTVQANPINALKCE